MKIRRAKAKGTGWRDHDLLCLGISVGQPYHENADFAAAVEFANKSGKSIVVRVSDTLQRHNLFMEGYPPDEAEQKALYEGDAWLQRNSKTLGQLENLTSVIRWNDLLSHKNYPTVHREIAKAIKLDKAFANAIDRDIERFLARRPGLSEKERICYKGVCFIYIVEEAAAQTMMARELPHALIYPSGFLDSLKMLQQGRVTGISNGLDLCSFTRLQISSKEWKTVPKQNSLQIAA